MTDKERLEQIQQNDLIQAISDGFLFGKDGLKTENIFRDVEWLIQQVERLEKENKRLRRELSIEKGCRYNESYVHGLEEENKRLREALEEIKSHQVVCVANWGIEYAKLQKIAHEALEGENNDC